LAPFYGPLYMATHMDISREEDQKRNG